MALDIHKLIAAIRPDIYCKPEKRDEVKSLVKEKGYKEASEKAEVIDTTFMDFDAISFKNPFDKPGQKNPIEKHSLTYDTYGGALEPIYFWILDNVSGEYGKADKIIDNFLSSPGSAHFSEMGQKATRMQEEAMKILSTANTIVKSILNLIYDLKEFKLRLEVYDALKSDKKEVKQGARLSLKQLWMDNVDIRRGNGSINMLAQQLDFVTIRDAFMVVEDESLKVDGKEIDLNDRVKRMLMQRIGEFNRWVKESEAEMRKRFEIEKLYLKSQVNSVKMYARWVKPYLKAAKQLEQNATPSAALVTAFNTTIFELVLLGEGKYNPDDDVAKGELPKMVKDAKKY